MSTEVLDAPALSKVAVYNPIEAGIALLLEKHGAVLTAPPDVSTPKALALTKTSRQELVKFRTRIEAARKSEKEASLTYGRLVDSEAKRITAIAAPIEKAYDDAIVAEETRLAVLEQEAQERERARKQALQARVDDIRNTVATVAGKPLADLDVVIAELSALPVDATFEEYETAAAEAKATTLARLDQMASGAREYERKLRELEIQRSETARVEAIKVRIADITGLLATATMARTAARLLPLIERCNAIRIDESFAEFVEQAEGEHARVLAGLQAIYDQKVADGKRAAELERQQQEQQATQARLDQQAKDQEAIRHQQEAAAAVQTVPAATQVTESPAATAAATASVVALAPPAPAAAQPQAEPTLNLGRICERLGFTVTAEFLKFIDILPATRRQGAYLYHDHQYVQILEALGLHLNTLLVAAKAAGMAERKAVAA